jgi:hypothetical protein
VHDPGKGAGSLTDELGVGVDGRAELGGDRELARRERVAKRHRPQVYSGVFAADHGSFPYPAATAGLSRVRLIRRRRLTKAA